MAEPAAGTDLRHRLPGRAVYEDAARGASGKSRGVRRYGGGSGGPQRSSGAVDKRQRRRQVLAGSIDRSEEPRGTRRADLLRRWTEGLSAGDREGVSGSGDSVVHRAPGAGESELCELERTQARSRRSEGDLPSGDG